jgi:hypothetical protein
MDLAEAVRKRANEMANDLEKRAAEARGEEESLTGLIKSLGPLDFDAGDYATARQEADRALRRAEVLVHTSRARAQLEEQQAKIRASLGPRPEVDTVQNQIAEISEEIGALDGKMLVLKEKLHALKMERARLGEARMRWEEQSEILRRTPEGPSPAEAEQHAKMAEALTARAAAAQTLSRAKEYQVKANAAHELAGKCADRAKQMRAIAQGTADALGRLLERRGLPGLVIDEGRLCVKNGKGKAKDFDTRLSFGERVRVALGIALAGQHRAPPEQAAGAIAGNAGTVLPILPLEPGFWLALDERHQAEISAIARESGICLITEEPGGGPLHVEARNP